MSLKKVGLIALLLVMGLCLMARPTLARDPNGTAIQFCRSYTTAADTVVTMADSTAVPANTVEATFICKDQIFYVRNQVTTTAAATNWIQIPAGIPITIPVSGNSYVCYKTLTGTGKIYFIWKKM